MTLYPLPGDRADYFENKHRDAPDPWGFASSWYERRKYAITLASLPRRRYRAVWEPGCSIGELTRLLADRADRLDASDVSATAVTRAQHATAGYAHVRVDRAALPGRPPGRDYDLVVLSEVLYYLPETDRGQVLQDVDASTAPDADLVVVHWRHHPSDAWASGAAVNRAIRTRDGWTPLARHEEPDFVLDVLTRHRGPAT